MTTILLLALCGRIDHDMTTWHIADMIVVNDVYKFDEINNEWYKSYRQILLVNFHDKLEYVLVAHCVPDMEAYIYKRGDYYTYRFRKRFTQKPIAFRAKIRWRVDTGYHFDRELDKAQVKVGIPAAEYYPTTTREVEIRP